MGFIKGRNAKEGKAGTVQLATVQESVAGTNTSKAVTPQGVKASVVANIPYATVQEAVAGTNTSKAVTPQGVKASVVANIPYATATRIGGIKIEFDEITKTLNIITEG